MLQYNGIIWVQGENGANNYNLAPNSLMPLWDSERQTIYLKSTDFCFARYQVIFNGNIAIPDGGTVGPIAVAITVSGEARPTSRAIYTPAAVDEYGNVTSTAIITVPRGCCFNMSVEYVSGIVNDPTATSTPSINVINANVVINRIA